MFRSGNWRAGLKRTELTETKHTEEYRIRGPGSTNKQVSGTGPGFTNKQAIIREFGGFGDKFCRLVSEVLEMTV